MLYVNWTRKAKHFSVCRLMDSVQKELGDKFKDQFSGVQLHLNHICNLTQMIKMVPSKCCFKGEAHNLRE